MKGIRWQSSKFSAIFLLQRRNIIPSFCSRGNGFSILALINFFLLSFSLRRGKSSCWSKRKKERKKERKRKKVERKRAKEKKEKDREKVEREVFAAAAVSLLEVAEES